MSSAPTKLRFIPIWAALALLAGALGTSAQSTSTADPRKSEDQPSPRQVQVTIDPRSSGETEAELLTAGFRNACPSVSIIRDESKAEYVVLASQASSGFFLHYYITVYDKQGQGKVAFAADRAITRRSSVGPSNPRPTSIRRPLPSSTQRLLPDVASVLVDAGVLGKSSTGRIRPSATGNELRWSLRW